MDRLDRYLDTIGVANLGKKKINNECCNNPDIRINEINRTCINCGRILEYDDFIIKPTFLNPKYQLTTSIGYGSRINRCIYRLHKWQNYDYRENTANKNYRIIREMGNGLNDRIINNACTVYKDIYIDQHISNRNKIKRSLFVYTLQKSCQIYNTYFDILKVLKYNGLSISNYNKALSNINDNNKLFLNKNMEIQYKKLKDNFYTSITIEEIIIVYNEIHKISKEKKCRLNNNSILICSIYKILSLENDDLEDKKFYMIFNITHSTIKKYLKIN